MRNQLSEEDKQIIENLYKLDEHSFKSIGRLIGRDYRVIKKHLKILGYETKNQSLLQRKYKINENFFDNIDDEFKSYVLGFLYADGCNSTERNAVIINIKDTDRDILQKITDLIQPDKPIAYVDTSKQIKEESYKNSSNQYRFVIANKHISHRLVELGCGKAKTHNLTFPTEAQVPKHLQRHFIRGYFDGDGSISGDKQKQISITGNEGILKDIQEILVNELSFSKTKFDKRWKTADNDITSLRYCGKNQCIKFRDWIYKDANIFLDRKREIFKLL